MWQNNQKLILGKIVMKVMLIIEKKINLVYLEWHLSHYLIINGKYFTRG
jgi:hypothetical protein